LEKRPRWNARGWENAERLLRRKKKGGWIAFSFSLPLHLRIGPKKEKAMEIFRSACDSATASECPGTLNEPPPLPDPNARRPPLVPERVESHSAADSFKKGAAIVGTIGLLLLNFGAKLKFLIAPLLKFFPMVLKTGGTMILSIGVYAGLWGWKFALGFVLLIFVHELGHLVAAKKFGLNVGAPVFIPFMGAFIALKDAPKNAWIEAWVGIGGPILGAAGALVCHGIGEMTNQPLFIAIAWSGYWLNLFNLTPIGTLDGGRIVTALSPWLWIPGLGIMGYFAITRPNIIIWLVLAMSIPRIISLFRKKTDEEQRFYEVSPPRRWLIGSSYFGLIGALVFMMDISHRQLEGRGIAHRAEPAAASTR
jgi:Zn-dependent protease